MFAGRFAFVFQAVIIVCVLIVWYCSELMSTRVRGLLIPVEIKAINNNKSYEVLMKLGLF